jgi:hypothetical protein
MTFYDVRAQGVISIRKIADELNRRGIRLRVAVSGSPTAQPEAAGAAAEVTK